MPLRPLSGTWLEVFAFLHKNVNCVLKLSWGYGTILQKSSHTCEHCCNSARDRTYEYERSTYITGLPAYIGSAVPSGRKLQRSRKNEKAPVYAYAFPDVGCDPVPGCGCPGRGCRSHRGNPAGVYAGRQPRGLRADCSKCVFPARRGTVLSAHGPGSCVHFTGWEIHPGGGLPHGGRCGKCRSHVLPPGAGQASDGDGGGPFPPRRWTANPWMSFGT